jgi:tellurium resistance protein TerD
VGKDVDEIITIDATKVAPEVNEIPIFVTIHEAKANGLAFGKIGKAGIRIKDDAGTVLGEYELTTEFAAFDAVQMGSIMRTPANGWEFAAVGTGFKGDFNTILGHFS